MMKFPCKLVAAAAFAVLLAGGAASAQLLPPGGAASLPPPPAPPPPPVITVPVVPQIDTLPSSPKAAIPSRGSFGDRVTGCLQDGAAAGLNSGDRATYSRACANR